MLSIKIDNTDFTGKIPQFRTMGELVEYVKTTIDPDNIITSLKIAGQDLSDADWRLPLSVQGSSILEVETGKKSDYITARLSEAILYIEHISELFKSSRDLFKSSPRVEGNTAFGVAVGDLQAFCTWYSSILDMGLNNFAKEKIEFTGIMKETIGICEQLVQQQLYQAWNAMSDTIEQKLEPKLEGIKILCKEVIDRSAQMCFQ